MQIYRTVLASTDRLTLMSRAESQLNDDRVLAALPFGSPHLSRVDGVATRLDWQPTHPSAISRPVARAGPRINGVQPHQNGAQRHGLAAGAQAADQRSPQEVGDAADAASPAVTQEQIAAMAVPST